MCLCDADAFLHQEFLDEELPKGKAADAWIEHDLEAVKLLGAVLQHPTAEAVAKLSDRFFTQTEKFLREDFTQWKRKRFALD